LRVMWVYIMVLCKKVAKVRYSSLNGARDTLPIAL
jgi:hypothetical protein